MRKEFSQWTEQFGRRESRCIFLTGDLGFSAFENVRAAFGERFINMGVCEQNMMSVAAGLAREKLLPLCYSIAPFAVFRPLEQIRLDIALHNLPVKIVGNGGGYGYGIMGSSHHALEDLAVTSCLPNFTCVVPLCDADVAEACATVFRCDGPAYLRLGRASWPEEVGALPAFQPVRRLVAAEPGRLKITVVGIGPVLLNTLPWIADGGRADLFAISQLPLLAIEPVLLDSVRSSRLLLVLEEHAARGGLAEHLAAGLAREGVSFTMHHRCAVGYPHGRYGSQAFHQRQSGLDAASIQAALSRLIS